MSKFRWLPTSIIAWGYFAIVYGFLFPWFAICFIWGEVLKGGSVSPLWLRLQVQDLLGLLCLPPLMGMGADLFIAEWTNGQYKLMMRRIGIVVLLTAGFFTFLEIIRYYVIRPS